MKIKHHVTRIRREISCFWALELCCCFCKRSFHGNFVPYIWYKKRSSFLVLGQRLFSCNVFKKDRHILTLGRSVWRGRGGEGGWLPLSLKFFWFFYLTIKRQHLKFSVAVRLSLMPFWDKFSDGQLLWLRDMMS